MTDGRDNAFPRRQARPERSRPCSPDTRVIGTGPALDVDQGAAVREDDRYTVLVAKYGTRMATRAEVFLNYATYGEPDGPIAMDYFVWVVRNDARTIVVDTGFSRHGGESRGRQTLADPVSLVADLGVEIADGPTVIVTHAHYDHIGNLDRFPSSATLIAERELAFWTGPLADRPLFHHSVEDDELRHLAGLAEGGTLKTFRGSCEVAPGVEVIELGGHTPGQSVVRVQTAVGTVLLASDAVHYLEELEQDRPFSSVTSVADMYAGFDRIRAMVASGEVDIVVPGHDPDTLGRFTPLATDPTGLVATIGAAA
jgi:glyoxylase-like metal-dependent hydrolase (beta-lactamase superfamily II)